MKEGEVAFELFDISKDIGETTNLADSLPEMVRMLSGELDNWRQEVNAQMPVPNPAY
jgi:hypothetical protein